MVCYCCVKGCRNNAKNKNNDPNSIISFHAFPSYPGLKSKWLRAIGRPNWSPPRHARVCSAHFINDQINYDGSRIRLKDDAVPGILLPLNSNFEASDLEACRVCLATEVKMYSLQDTVLGACMETVTQKNENFNVGGLPQFVCYQCTPNLIKSSELIEKCIASQTILLDIFVKNNKDSLIKEHGRYSELQSLSSNNKFDKITSFDVTKTELIDSDVTYLKKENNQSIKIETQDIEIRKCNIEEKENELIGLRDNNEIPSEEGVMPDDDCMEDLSVDYQEMKSDSEVKHRRKTVPRKKKNGLTPDEIDMKKGVAKKHQRWHGGHVHECGARPLAMRHLAAARAHRRTAHAHTCALCGRAFSSARGRDVHTHIKHGATDKDITKEYHCEQCDIGFASENARRLHILTSIQHAKKPDLCGISNELDLRKCCKRCGKDCGSFKELVLHNRAEHGRVRRSSHPWRGNTPYPIPCEICGETISTRRKHWLHVRRQHPKEVNTYQPVITAVCDTCGKGYQNTTKLRLHKLRHRSPTVRCQVCPRMFYDRYALMRHARTHNADKPHQCRVCGRAFKVQSNLDRHARVHTDIAPYECTMCGKKFKHSSSVNLHVRTVHYKLPQPPRKKRRKSAKDDSGL